MEHGPDPEAVNDRPSFGRELTALRLLAGLTVREVAERAQAGGTHSTVGDWFAGRGLPSLASKDLLVQVLTACGVDGPDELAPWLAGWRRARAAAVRRSTGPEPYRGLSPYQAEDAGWFFGRAALTAALLGRLADLPPGRAVLLAVGVSGAGKSSLLRAGLIPQVHAGGIGHEPDWEVLLCTPGADPLAGLAEVGETGVESRLLIVVDQFEELFTVCADETRRQAFVDRLFELAAGPRRAVVVIGLRADFYAEALRFPALLATARHRQLTIGPMTEEELREVIVEPARRARAQVEEGLVEVLLRDVPPGSGSLPLLSHALLATWSRGGGRMTIGGYRRIGGIAGAVSETAESVFASLTRPQQELARRLFLRLVHVAPETADTRRRVTRAELADLDRGGGELAAVLEKYVAQRLITTATDAVEISHETLVSAWPRLRGWLDSDRSGLVIARQLHVTALDWQADGRDPGQLYQGARLAAAQAWAASADADLTVPAAEFLAASRRHSRRRARRTTQLVTALATLTALTVGLAGVALDQRADVEQQRREAVHQRNEAVSRLIAGRADKLRDSDVSLAMQLSLAAYRTAPTVEARSSLLDASAVARSTRLLPFAGPAQAVAHSPDGRLLAAGGTDHTVRLWSTGPGHAVPVTAGDPLPGVDEEIFGLAFDRRGGVLAAAGSGGTVRLWDVRDPARPAPLPSLPDRARATVYSLSFSSDGVLAAGSADGRVRRWDVSAVERPVELPALAGAGPAAQAVAFHPARPLLAVAAADGSVRLWDGTNQRRPTALPAVLASGGGKILSVAFSPDGRTLAAGSAEKTVRLFDLTDVRRPRPIGAPLTGPNSWVNAVAFSPDGRSVAGGSSDDTVTIWEADGGRTAGVLPQPAPVTGVSFTPDGETIATSSTDGTVRLWQTPPGPVLTGPQDAVFSIAYSPDGTSLAVASRDETVRFWDVSRPDAPKPLGSPLRSPTADAFSGTIAFGPGGRTLAVGTRTGRIQVWDLVERGRPALERTLVSGSALVQSVAFSPDGQLLAAGGDDHRITLWDGSGRRLGSRQVGAAIVLTVTFSPDGRLLASAGSDGAVRLWDVTGGGDPALVGQPLVGFRGYAYSAAFSPDGRTLAAASADSTVRLWDVSAPGAPSAVGTPLTGPAGYAYMVAFRPDNRQLAVAATDGTVWLWDLGDLARPTATAVLSRATGAVYAVTFSPDGRTLAATGSDHVTRLSDIDADRVARWVCATSGVPISSEEWHRYVPGVRYQPPCP
ncbi:helix-turn-helix domain-containing protein [Micromonospora carbonacea]|uniref:nSTAND1 domain-containing NTPase n=1 Tax=Micromonospora carbonacea TaxID=47853 RepID=UPI003D739BFF